MDGNLNHEICFPARRRLNLIPWETDLSCGRKQRMHQSRCFKHPGRSPFGSHPVFPVTSPAAARLALLKCGRFTVSYLPCLTRVPVMISCRPIATPLYVMTLFQQDIFKTSAQFSDQDQAASIFPTYWYYWCYWSGLYDPGCLSPTIILITEK